MRVLFLDFDGVLNSERWMLAQPKTVNFLRALDRAAVSLLAEIISRTQARIVVSSSWRRMYSLDALRAILVESGLPASCEVIAVTPALDRSPDGDKFVRGDEIQHWLDEASRGEQADKIELFAILDDDDDMAHLGHRLVRTSFKTGLDRAAVERTITLLTPDGELRCRRCCSENIDLEPAALGPGAACFNVDCRVCGAAYGV